MPGTKSTKQQLQENGHFANVCKSKTVNRMRIEDVLNNNTVSRPEKDQIQSVNDIFQIDFHKAILLVQGQPIDFIIDTSSPVTKFLPLFNPKETHKTTTCFVDVNKNPVKFKGEAMMEVRTETSEETLPILTTENRNTHPLMGLDWLDKLEIGLQGNKNTGIIMLMKGV